jgi:hypothetical protein
MLDSSGKRYSQFSWSRFWRYEFVEPIFRLVFNLGQYKLVSHSMVDSSPHVRSICLQLLDLASSCKVRGVGTPASAINV